MNTTENKREDFTSPYRFGKFDLGRRSEEN